jgi:acetyl-CoA synthetase
MYKSFNNYWKSKSTLVDWYKSPVDICSFDNKYKRYIWYKDGKINIYYNCVEKHLPYLKDKCAIKYLDKQNNLKELTYHELYLKVEHFSIFLRNKISKKGKVKVAIHSSASIEAAVAMLACCKLGILFTVVFQTLPAESLLTRLKIFKPDLLITKSNISEIKKKILPIIKNLNKIQKNKIKIVYFEHKNKIKTNYSYNMKRSLNKKNIIRKIPTRKLASDDSSFVLFTSGSTGNPKGVEHTTGGYILYSKLTCVEQFGMNKNSNVLTLSDAGWINGHTYALFGPLSIGATTLLVEDPMMMLNSDLLEDVIKQHNITILYLPVTIIRLLKALIPKKKFNFPNLKSIGSMGEPLAQNVANWFSSTFGKNKMPVVNTYFQTETGGIICSPRFNNFDPLKYSGTVGKSLNKYIKLNIFSKKKNKKNLDLKIISPWPGCMKNIINSKKIFNSYFDSKFNFKLFDIGKLDKNNNLLVFGRSDDVMNVRGHRIGSGEIENQILKINSVKEVCAISCKDVFEGEKVVIFFSKKKKAYNKDLIDQINYKIINYFGKWSKPKFIIELNQLPKTRSGKILRRILRVLVNDPKKKNIGDVSTIFDRNAIKEIRSKILKY